MLLGSFHLFIVHLTISLFTGLFSNLLCSIKMAFAILVVLYVFVTFNSSIYIFYSMSYSIPLRLSFILVSELYSSFIQFILWLGLFFIYFHLLIKRILDFLLIIKPFLYLPCLTFIYYRIYLTVCF